MSVIKDKMELAKAEAYIDGDGKITADHYFDILEEEGIILDKEKDVVDNGDGTYEVTTEPGYVFEVTIEEDGDIEIDYIGKGENIGPRIREIRISNKTTNSITVEVDARNAEDGEYTYSYQKVGETEWQEVETSKNNTCTIDNLEANESYTIKVKVETKNGTDEDEISTTIGELPEGTITYGEVEWVGDGTASVVINTSEEGYQLQYQKNSIEGQWTTIGSGEKITGLEHNDTVYGRLFDGVNGTKDDASISIQDLIDPVVTVREGIITTNSITVSVEAKDNESGMADSVTYTYYIKKTSEPDSSYTPKETGITQNSYTFTGLQQETSYDVKVEVNGDKAGRTGTGTLANQTTTKVGGAGDLATGNIVASTPTWSGGTASITLTTTTGMQIQYQINGITEGNWTTVSTGATVSGLHHNDTVYARLWDGNNAGDEASVSIQDGIDPVVTVSPGTKTTNSIAISVSAIDNESGMADSLTYTYYIKKSTEADSSYVAKANGIAQNSYTFTGLTQETSYDVKVEVIGDKAGRKGTGTLLNQATTKVGGASSGLVSGNIVASTPTWSGGSASITLTTNTGMQIQYQKNSISGNWTTVSTGATVSGLHHNDTVYARLWDGNNAGDEASVSIVDNTPPTVEISTSNLTYNSVTLNVTASDGQSGLATSGTYTYYLNNEQKISNTTNSYNYTGLTAGTQYTLKVIVTDKAGKTTEKSTTITTTKAEIADIVGGSDLDKTTEVEDDEGNSIWIPGGFNVTEDSATTEDEGIVIEDSKGNQFVWVPVKDYTTMYTVGTKTLNGVTTQTTVYSKLRVRSEDTSSYTPTTPGTTTGIREPDVLSSYDTDSQYYSILGASSTKDMADKMVAEYKATYESIKKYKGFYIGRYELTGSVESPTVQKGKTVVTEQNWYNLKEACTNIVSTTYAQTMMIYGNQWDEVMSWLKTTEFASDPSKVDSDSSSWGNYSTSTGAAATNSGEKRPSGYNEAWQANNIYDLAGNCYEWTQEAYFTFFRVYRGGYYSYGGSDTPASDRNGSHPDVSNSRFSSRPALYIK